MPNSIVIISEPFGFGGFGRLRRLPGSVPGSGNCWAILPHPWSLSIVVPIRSHCLQRSPFLPVQRLPGSFRLPRILSIIELPKQRHWFQQIPHQFALRCISARLVRSRYVPFQFLQLQCHSLSRSPTRPCSRSCSCSCPCSRSCSCSCPCSGSGSCYWKTLANICTISSIIWRRRRTMSELPYIFAARFLSLL